MKTVKKIASSLLALFLIFALSIPSEAQTMSGQNRARVVTQNGNAIQRIYNSGGLVYAYTHNITYHFDSARAYAVEVEHGTNAAAYGTQYAASKGINTSSFTPAGATGAWVLVGWKQKDASANTTNVNNNIVSTADTDLYAVWAKDCTSYFNFNGGACTAWNSFGTDWYARGNAYYNNGNITPFRVTLPGVTRANYTLTSITNNGAGSYAAGGTYDLTDKATFVCNWKINEIPLEQRGWIEFARRNTNQWSSVPWTSSDFDSWVWTTINPANKQSCYIMMEIDDSDRNAQGYAIHSRLEGSGCTWQLISESRTGVTGSGTYRVKLIYKATNYNGTFQIRANETAQRGRSLWYNPQIWISSN